MTTSQPLDFDTLSEKEMIFRSIELFDVFKKRRTVRDFLPNPIPRQVLENCLRIAGRAPSGANQQPWHFAVVQSAEIKNKIRIAAEAEEREFYSGRAPQPWLDALAHLGTNSEKPYLEEAPAMIAIFQKSKITDAESGSEIKTYYPKESVGLATGFLISALHQCGLASLTHTPSPMNFLNEILNRPSSEKAFVLLIVGYPSEGCQVPRISKEPLEVITSYH